MYTHPYIPTSTHAFITVHTVMTLHALASMRVHAYLHLYIHHPFVTLYAQVTVHNYVKRLLSMCMQPYMHLLNCMH